MRRLIWDYSIRIKHTCSFPHIHTKGEWPTCEKVIKKFFALCFSGRVKYMSLSTKKNVCVPLRTKLKVTGYIWRLSHHFCTRKTTFVTSCKQIPSLGVQILSFYSRSLIRKGNQRSSLIRKKEVYSIRKEFAPSGSKFFPYRVDHFLEGGQNPFDGITAPESKYVLLQPKKNCVRFTGGGGGGGRRALRPEQSTDSCNLIRSIIFGQEHYFPLSKPMTSAPLCHIDYVHV